MPRPVPVPTLPARLVVLLGRVVRRRQARAADRTVQDNPAAGGPIAATWRQRWVATRPPEEPPRIWR